MLEMPATEPQTILITGTSTGFGQLAAISAAQRGHRVYASMRDIDARNAAPAQHLRQFAIREGLNLQPLNLDVTDQSSVDAAIAQITGESGALDVLVNNAGQMSIGLAEGFTEEQMRQQFEVNFFGPVRLCRAVLPAMRHR